MYYNKFITNRPLPRPDEEDGCRHRQGPGRSGIVRPREEHHRHPQLGSRRSHRAQQAIPVQQWDALPSDHQDSGTVQASTPRRTNN